MVYYTSYQDACIPSSGVSGHKHLMKGAVIPEESSSQKKDSENQCTPQSIGKATPGEQIETWRILRFFYQLWRIFCTIIFKSLLFLGLSSRAAVEEPKDNHLRETISTLGLEDYVSEKLTLSSVLEVGIETITDANIQTLRNLPWNFLKKLMVLNNTARNTHCTTGTSADETQLNLTNIGDMFTDIKIDSNQSINPLDVVTTLFLSSDCLLQQQIMLKMSMCQFALPLLLPDYRNDNCILLQWALREIVKKWRPQSLESCKGFKEKNLTVTSMPTISFVRLGNCTLSKSKLLNDVLSSLQQQNNFFIHHNMQCGNVPRTISDGLVEIYWYLPCGKKNLDAFPEAFAATNLRGDARSKSIQFEFMRKISTAVFVFVESIDRSTCKLLSSIDKSETQYFFILSSQSSKQKVTLDHLKKLATNLQLEQKHQLRKSNQMNEADFVRKVQKTIKDVLKHSSIMKNVEEMAVVARELKFQVDEDDEKCFEARMHAEEIISKIQNVGDYKKKVLPLQGNILKELAQLEKEMHRLRKLGNKPIEEYKCDLENKIMKLREKQYQYEPSEGILSFITALVGKSTEERHYFLKWMKFFLDTVARENLSDLRDRYKTQYKGSQDHSKELTELDQKLADSSLGLEHFMREIGQIYEAESLLIDKGKLNNAQKQFALLANLLAELMLEGYPLELINGDASHVPVRWVNDVLKQLKKKMGNSSRIRVITVLGVQGTGKSTLLNTMFGLQFVVSSGRCTRGAFMLLIRVKEGFRKILSCDFLLVIDTEGLKSPELAKLDDSYEHDNELATLVVGLSDITLINMAMENSTEMKDILQIVVHAFLRMKETGKKPNCQFVHQNVGDVSAHDQNMRDRKLLLEQLNEMTKAAAKMEKKDSYSKFSDVMEYDAEKDNWYIPGLWHGIPPMAPVNTGYSENIYELKKSLFKTLKQKKQRSLDILEFNEWVKSLWNAVKYENFIFNFRNSLVADAYNQLCINYAEWEWEFRKNMHCWLLEAENRIHNQLESELGGFFQALKAEAYEKLQNEEKKMLDKLENYFQSNGANVHLVERYRETFFKSANLLKTELEGHVLNKFEETLNICKSAVKFEKIQSEAREEIEREVTRLLNTCRNDLVHKQLGLEIIQDISDSPRFIQYNSRVFFQFTILKDMLERREFDAYLKYISNYEQYVKKWIVKQIEHRYMKDVKLADVEKRCLSVIIQKVKKAVDRMMNDETTETVFEFLEKLCNILEKDIVISKESLGLILFENQENIKQFSSNIQNCIEDMEATLISEFEKTSNVTEKLTNLPIKPQDVFFKKVFGCGKQCPFCKVPCEAGGEGHEHHFASVHRPQGLGGSRCFGTNNLPPEICSTDVNSERKFLNDDTNWELHPYKNYRKYYPEWEIQGDPSIEASDYWKYVMVQFNKQFAESYKAKEADIPSGWKNITADQALNSLQEMFCVK
ncbi:LOW QUALITY PROTEIN: up-regulator of cell proliferation-like [Latimeria chalumnae]|uniref:LOW QUALITY PROTEIN: up-regulator of cell proliferation-like n=1 Tax=Latimeria chalumnae TaxID=7897 RepID=UPI00313AB70C